MSEFRVRLGSIILDTYFISDGDRDYMHRDGEVIHDACEYFPTEEQAQAVLDKFRPTPPPHVWVDGDVGVDLDGEIVVLAHCDRSSQQHYIVLNGDSAGAYEEWDNIDASCNTFLYNVYTSVKDILSDRGLA